MSFHSILFFAVYILSKNVLGTMYINRNSKLVSYFISIRTLNTLISLWISKIHLRIFCWFAKIDISKNTVLYLNCILTTGFCIRFLLPSYYRLYYSLVILLSMQENYCACTSKQVSITVTQKLIYTNHQCVLIVFRLIIIIM